MAEILHVSPVNKLVRFYLIDNVYTGEISLYNEVNKSICFRLRSTHPDIFKVKPNIGVLQGSTADNKLVVAITVINEKDFSIELAQQYRFQLQALYAPDEDDDDFAAFNPLEIWDSTEQAKWYKVAETKFRPKFVPAGEEAKEKEEALKEEQKAENKGVTSKSKSLNKEEVKVNNNEAVINPDNIKLLAIKPIRNTLPETKFVQILIPKETNIDPSNSAQANPYIFQTLKKDYRFLPIKSESDASPSPAIQLVPVPKQFGNEDQAGDSITDECIAMDTIKPEVPSFAKVENVAKIEVKKSAPPPQITIAVPKIVITDPKKVVVEKEVEPKKPRAKRKAKHNEPGQKEEVTMMSSVFTESTVNNSNSPKIPKQPPTHQRHLKPKAEKAKKWDKIRKLFRKNKSRKDKLATKAPKVTKKK